MFVRAEARGPASMSGVAFEVLWRTRAAGPEDSEEGNCLLEATCLRDMIRDEFTVLRSRLSSAILTGKCSFVNLPNGRYIFCLFATLAF